MKLSPLALCVALIGMAGTLDAAKPASKGKAHKAAKGSKAGVPAGSYKVKKGDTGTKVAQKFSLELDELKAMNPKVDFRKLTVGTTLVVRAPKKAEPGKAPAAGTEAVSTPPAVPAPALPSTPSPKPATLLHLERMLPAKTQGPTPEGPAGSARSAWIQPMLGPLPPSSPEGSPAAFGFEPCNPDHLDLLWPVETRTISSGWGPRMRTRTVVKVKADRKRRIKTRYRGSHRGLDLNAPTGTDVYAALDGRVIESGRHRQYGNFVAIDHGNGVVTLYAHNSVLIAQAGDLVQRGQKIAEVGATGNATGPHLHFELRVDGLFRNPLPVLNDVEEIPAEMMARNEASSAPRTRR